MNGLDLLLLVLLVLAGYSGYRRGVTLQAFGFGGLLVGLAAGALLAPVVARELDGTAARAGAAAIVLLALAGLGNAAGWVIGIRARAKTASRFGKADAVAGSAVAVVGSMLAIWFIALNLVNGPFPELASEVRGSAIVRTLDAALPEPPSLLAQVRQLFSRFGFPDVFTGIPPLPAEPVGPPTQEQARAAVTAAQDSTVRIVGRACDEFQEGSAFVVAEGYLVTNAHVVAGVDDPLVQDPGGPSLAGVTVLFDPELDVAVLRVDGSPGPPLPLDTGTLERGDTGAVLGYPEGGPLSAEPAAVRRTIDAIGRDIYGESQVNRLVVELQAQVRPGDSGGPFVLSDGRVGGVVFAASTGEPDVGYAIASSEVRDAVARAIGRVGEVGTGRCLQH